MMGEKPEDFKVIDRRSSSGAGDEEKKPAPSNTAKGDNFTMADAKSTPPSEIDFATLIYSFATGALISMGAAPDPNTKKTQKDMGMAKQNIEILTMLQAKTKGNLTADESKFLENILTEVRLRFVEASKK